MSWHDDTNSAPPPVHSSAFHLRPLASEDSDDAEGAGMLDTTPSLPEGSTLASPTPGAELTGVTSDIAPAAAAAPAPLDEETVPRTRRSSRQKRPRVVVSDDEDESHCAAEHCAEVGQLEMVACSGPACGAKFHLCCVGLKRHPGVSWFCDDVCRENSTGRARKKQRM
ncbi:hypothetical protein C8R46DRAFT_1283872 [Mycena filopes]|nr:hypothetical protein C8R46DRAFT_1359155 [Mycena filopes]KAJ7161613.1 hypothetical protein C8R46DRAFT_1283872 [Mycena filopes]